MLYATTIFLSAFLLFQLELICAKRLLPWFGGSPAVWTTCQVFFQIALLAGYSYAHALAASRSRRRQSTIHLAVLAASVVVLIAGTFWAGVPVLAPAALKPSGLEQPIPLLLLILLSTVGVPFVALSATGPLLQHWHSQVGAPLDRTYRLYAFSNTGSLLGLLSYPFGVERVLDLPGQSWLWAAVFLAFSACCGALAWRWLSTGSDAFTPASSRLEGDGPGSTIPGGLRPGFWVTLSFASSALFLATTNHLCQEVAVVPFMWVLPLAIYLMTFIVCFERPHWYSRRWCVSGAVLTSAIVFLQRSVGAIYVPAQIIEYAANLAFLCMLCHGELFRLRPVSSKLTLYYLLIAIGGALGGALVSLAAPVFFVGLWEFPAMLLLAWLALASVWALDRSSGFWIADGRYFAPLAALAGFIMTPFVIVLTPLHRLAWMVQNVWVASLYTAAAAAALAAMLAARRMISARTLWLRSLLAAMVLLGTVNLWVRMHEFRSHAVYAARNFFGLVRVLEIHDDTDRVGAYELMHNQTIHGVAFASQDLKALPTTYYSPSTGIGVAARSLETRAYGADHKLKIGILGLGIGTIAAYAHAGDDVRVYEIDPLIMEIAGKSSRYFSFIRDCEGRIEMVPGDARISLERELQQGGSQKFDLLALDAFSGDAIPVHLITEEAFRLYAAHLRDAASILAVHITNGRLNLEPVVAAAARKLGFGAIVVNSEGDANHWPEPSIWILLSRDAAAFDQPSIRASDHRPLEPAEILFTDRFSNLFAVLR